MPGWWHPRASAPANCGGFAMKKMLMQGPGNHQPGMNLERHPVKVGPADDDMALEPLIADMEAD